jgi:hypothetical protein
LDIGKIASIFGDTQIFAGILAQIMPKDSTGMLPYL